MAISFDPIRPYLGLIKAGLVAALLAAVFVQGCSVGQDKSDATHAKTIAKKDTALRNAAASLRAAATALEAINAETARLLKAEAEAKAREQDAAEVAAKARADLEKRTASFAQAIKHARKNPDCNALLSADVRKICEL